MHQKNGKIIRERAEGTTVVARTLKITSLDTDDTQTNKHRDEQPNESQEGKGFTGELNLGLK